MGGVESIVVDDTLPEEGSTPPVLSSSSQEWAVVTMKTGSTSDIEVRDCDTDCESTNSDVTLHEEDLQKDELEAYKDDTETDLDSIASNDENAPQSLLELPADILAMINKHVGTVDTADGTSKTCHLAHERFYKETLESGEIDMKISVLEMILKQGTPQLLQSLLPTIEGVYTDKNCQPKVKNLVSRIRARYMDHITEGTIELNDEGVESYNPLFDANIEKENEVLQREKDSMPKDMSELELVRGSDYLSDNPRFKLQAAVEAEDGTLEVIGEIDSDGDVVVGDLEDMSDDGDDSDGSSDDDELNGSQDDEEQMDESSGAGSEVDASSDDEAELDQTRNLHSHDSTEEEDDMSVSGSDSEKQNHHNVEASEHDMVMNSTYQSFNPMFKLAAAIENPDGTLEVIGEIDSDGDVFVGDLDDTVESSSDSENSEDGSDDEHGNSRISDDEYDNTSNSDAEHDNTSNSQATFEYDSTAIETDNIDEVYVAHSQHETPNEYDMVMNSTYQSDNPRFKLAAAIENSDGTLEVIGEIDSDGDVFVGDMDDLEHPSDTQSDSDSEDESDGASSSHTAAISDPEAELSSSSLGNDVSPGNQGDTENDDYLTDADIDATEEQEAKAAELLAAFQPSAEELEAIMNSEHAAYNPLFEGEISDSEGDEVQHQNLDGPGFVEELDEPEEERTQIGYRGRMPSL